jgi:hypothetical protein
MVAKGITIMNKPITNGHIRAIINGAEEVAVHLLNGKYRITAIIIHSQNIKSSN